MIQKHLLINWLVKHYMRHKGWQKSLDFDGLQTCCINSGLRKEKPANSFWSRFIMNSLSVGVRSVPSLVNCRSKFETSLRWRWKIRHIKYFLYFKIFHFLLSQRVTWKYVTVFDSNTFHKIAKKLGFCINDIKKRK